MKFAKIQFESRDVCAMALHGMMQCGKVIGLRDRVFFVPSVALEWLASESLPYKLLEMMNQDDVVQALRKILPTRYNDGSLVESDRFQSEIFRAKGSICISHGLHYML